MWWWHDSEQGREPLNKIYRQLMVSNEEELSVYTTFGKEGGMYNYCDHNFMKAGVLCQWPCSDLPVREPAVGYLCSVWKQSVTVSGIVYVFMGSAVRFVFGRVQLSLLIMGAPLGH